MRSKVVLLLLAFLPLISSEYYCYVKGLGKSCRRCKNLSESCERPLPSQGCQCDHIEILRGKFLPTTVKMNIFKCCIFSDGKYVGGSDCRSRENDIPWCYVNQYSKCRDKTRSGFNDRELWLNSNGVYWSEEACQGGGTADVIGNELFLPGYKIISDRLPSNEGGGGFKTPSAEACQTECYERVGICGAWSFNVNNQKCTLHSVSACCNQFGKRRAADTYMSGYICPHCWSTRNQCPCPKGELEEGRDNKYAADGNYAVYNSGTNGIASIKRPCQYKRYIWKWSSRRRRWIRVKSRSGGFDNPDSNRYCD